jgi:hypothetical protein
LRVRDARALLDSAVPGRLDERVRDRIVAETKLNVSSPTLRGALTFAPGSPAPGTRQRAGSALRRSPHARPREIGAGRGSGADRVDQQADETRHVPGSCRVEERLEQLLVLVGIDRFPPLSGEVDARSARHRRVLASLIPSASPISRKG